METKKIIGHSVGDQYQKANDALYDIALNKSDIEAFVKLRQSMKSSREPASNTLHNASVVLGQTQTRAQAQTNV